MNNYYCPYCNPKYQFHKKSTSGELICGLCGDPLVKKPLIKINQIIAIIASLSLVLPLIYTFIILIKNQINPPSKNYKANTNFIEKNSKPRFYQPLNGDIRIDNQSIYDTSLNSVRKNISLVSQETTLFDDTIKNNIRYANENASDEEIFEVAKLSNSHDFIEKLPKKYDTEIGENGVRLSGGEKQRISIARAMIKKSKVILLDEATSSLDSESEGKIQEAINVLINNKTTIVIAHRLSTILNSNNIYLIDSGKVVDNGTHEDLLLKSKLYKNFYEKQIQK